MNEVMFALGFGCGGAAIWFGKSLIMKMVMGANALSAKLHADANALTDAAKKL